MGLVSTTLDKSVYDPDTDPIWCHPAWVDLFADAAIGDADVSPRLVPPGLRSAGMW